jgi:uncharacterized membrane protein
LPNEEDDEVTRRVNQADHPPRRRSLDGDIVDVVEGIDEESIQKIASIMEASSGPFPPPMFLERYEQIVEGSARQLMDSGIRRVEATTEIDLLESRTKTTIDLRGQIFALVVVMSLLITSTIWLALGHAHAATILATSTIVALVIAFIGSTRIEKVAPYLGRKRPDPNTEDRDEKTPE